MTVFKFPELQPVFEEQIADERVSVVQSSLISQLEHATDSILERYTKIKYKFIEDAPNGWSFSKRAEYSYETTPDDYGALKWHSFLPETFFKLCCHMFYCIPAHVFLYGLSIWACPNN